MRTRSCGEVFVALDKSSHDLVAMKKMKSDSRFESESSVLKTCQSCFVARYRDILKHENAYWVSIA